MNRTIDRTLDRAGACPDDLSTRALESRVLLAIIRLSSHEGDLSILDREVLDTLGRIVDGRHRREATIDAINRLNIAVLVRTRRRLAIDNAPSVSLSDDERGLLDSLDSLRQDPCTPGEQLLNGQIEPAWQPEFRQAALAVTGAIGRRASLPARAMLSSAARVHRPRPPVRDIDALELGEVTTLLMIRLWVRGIGMRFSGTEAVRLMGDHVAEPVLAEVVCAILDGTARSLRRHFDVRCLCCSEPSPDEARVLAAIAALAGGRLADYGHRLLAWLPAEEADRLMLGTGAASYPLHVSGARLPCRNWNIATLVARQPLFAPPTGVEGHTVHWRHEC